LGRASEALEMTGVVTGVLSAVDSRPLSLALGEEMSGGGVSIESSFTAVVVI